MKKITIGTLILLILMISGCGEKKSADRMSDAELLEYASQLAHRFIITDGHVDLPTALLEKKFHPGVDNDSLIHTGKGDFDFDRARQGGLDAPFMSIYVPSEYQQRPDKGKGFADSLINMVRSIAAQLPEKFALANSPEDVRANFKAGKISLPMGMENGAPIGEDLKNVQYFFDRGIRYITLTHGKDNQISDSSYDSAATWNGLSPFGKQVVTEMNRVGIMVDISHVSDSAFYQVLHITKIPVIASHSSCRYFTPGFRRNMSDDMIKKLGENGGIIQISFGSAFLDSAVRAENAALRKKLDLVLTGKKLKFTDPLAKPVIEQFEKENPSRFADVEKVVDHIDHAVKLIGADHVGFGSDFDGVGNSLPTGLKDVSMYPHIIYGLLKRGYTEADIEKICGGNLLRIWQRIQEASSIKG